VRKLSGKAMGRPRKPLAEVYSQERPVARHFVWGQSCTLHAIRNLMKTQTLTGGEAVGFSTTLERFTLAASFDDKRCTTNCAGGVSFLITSRRESWAALSSPNRWQQFR